MSRIEFETKLAGVGLVKVTADYLPAIDTNDGLPGMAIPAELNLLSVVRVNPELVRSINASQIADLTAAGLEHVDPTAAFEDCRRCRDCETLLAKDEQSRCRTCAGEPEYQRPSEREPRLNYGSAHFHRL